MSTIKLEPTTAAANSTPFTITNRTAVIAIYPSTGTTITDDQSSALKRLCPSGEYIQVSDLSGDIIMGVSLNIIEGLSAGTYRIEKGATIEAIGVEFVDGTPTAPYGY